MQRRSMVGGELAIAGYRQRPIPNRFIRQEPSSTRLAIIFPGYNYTCDLPLLYFSTSVLEATAHDILLVDTFYPAIDEFATASDEERRRWQFADASACVRATRDAGTYDHLTLVGKSIGTLAIGHVLADNVDLPTRAVWLTPLVRNERLTTAILATPVPSLFVAGTADPALDPTELDRLVSATGGQSHIVEGADHSLEIPGDVPASIAAIAEYIDVLTRFIASSAVDAEKT